MIMKHWDYGPEEYMTSIFKRAIKYIRIIYK